MTTSVKVTNSQYADWDVEVVAIDYRGQWCAQPRETVLATLKPGEQYEAHATDTRVIVAREVKHT